MALSLILRNTNWQQNIYFLESNKEHFTLNLSLLKRRWSQSVQAWQEGGEGRGQERKQIRSVEDPQTVQWQEQTLQLLKPHCLPTLA